MKKIIMVAAPVFFLVIAVLYISGVRVVSHNTHKKYNLNQSEIAHLAYEAFVNKDSGAANRIGAYFQFCTKEYDFGAKWLELADSFNMTNATPPQDAEGGGGSDEGIY